MNRLSDLFLVLNLAAVLVGRLDEALGVVRVDSVQDGEEVGSVRPASLGHPVREVQHEGSVVVELGVKQVDTQLIVARYFYHLNLIKT